MSKDSRLRRLERAFSRATPTLCPHRPAGYRMVEGGKLLPERDPCPCGRPRAILMIGYDSDESYQAVPPSSIEHLMGDEPVKTYVGVSLDVI